MSHSDTFTFRILYYFLYDFYNNFTLNFSNFNPSTRRNISLKNHTLGILINYTYHEFCISISFVLVHWIKFCSRAIINNGQIWLLFFFFCLGEKNLCCFVYLVVIYIWSILGVFPFLTERYKYWCVYLFNYITSFVW